MYIGNTGNVLLMRIFRVCAHDRTLLPGFCSVMRKKQMFCPGHTHFSRHGCRTDRILCFLPAARLGYVDIFVESFAVNKVREGTVAKRR